MSSPVTNKVVPVESITEAFPLASPKPNNDSGSGETPPEISPAEQLGAPSRPTKALKKRMEDEGHEERSRAAYKKRRLIWTPELHCVFVDACNPLAKDAVPKEILRYMKSQGVTDLTRENVASHLQKYRLYLKKLGTGTDEFEASSNLHLKSVPLNVTKESNFKPSSSCTQNNNPSSRSSITLHRTSSDQPMAVLPPLDQTQYSTHNMLQQPLLNHSAAVQELATATGNGNVWDVNGGTEMGFLNPPTTANWPNMIDVGEIQENSIWAMQYPPQLPQPNPIEQAFNQPVDYSLTNNILQPQSVSNQFSSTDGHRAFPWMGYSADLYNDFDYSFFGGFDQYHHEAMALEKFQVDDCEKKMDLPDETMKPAAFNVTR